MRHARNGDRKSVIELEDGYATKDRFSVGRGRGGFGGAFIIYPAHGIDEGGAVRSTRRAAGRICHTNANKLEGVCKENRGHACMT